MPRDTDPYEPLLNEIGNPRTIRGVLEAGGDWEERIPELVERVKGIAKELPKLPDQEAQAAWDANFNNLVRAAAVESSLRVKSDPFIALRQATGGIISITSFQKMFRSLWDRQLDSWYALPIETREKLFKDILAELSQTSGILPSNPDELARSHRRLHALINLAGERSWSLMKRSTAKLKRDRASDHRASNEVGAGEVRAGEVNTAREVRAGEVGAGEVGAGEVGAVDAGVGEVGAPRARTGETEENAPKI
ncbi:hypothetical protein DFP73DRAFT_627871 [Morchella snyderi]|nr:hypothetical protein DFP73DRAFT_627871 [Morchella snyderi]